MAYGRNALAVIHLTLARALLMAALCHEETFPSAKLQADATAGLLPLSCMKSHSRRGMETSRKRIRDDGSRSPKSARSYFYAC